jgi:hypothetical protein
MSNKSLAITSRTATELLSSSAETELRAMTGKLMRLTPGGRKLNTNQAAELAVYCFMTDLNPFNYEAYYMDGVGPIPGVAGVRRKANDYLAITSGPDDRFFVYFRDAQVGEANFDPDKGDIAKHASLTIRTVSERWQQNALRIYAELVKAGMDTDTAWERAEKMNGPEPVWTAVGVVDHRENFSRKPGTKGPQDPGTHDKWDRHQRAEKRAEKWAIRKAFPSVILPDVDLGEQSNIDATIVDAIVRDVTEELATKLPERPAGQVIEELGYKPGKSCSDCDGTGERDGQPCEYCDGTGDYTKAGKAEEPEKEVTPEGNGPEPPAKMWDEEFVKALLSEKVAQHPKQAVAILNLLQPSTPEQAALLGTIYRAWRNSGIDDVNVAAEKTLKGEQP